MQNTFLALTESNQSLPGFDNTLGSLEAPLFFCYRLVKKGEILNLLLIIAVTFLGLLTDSSANKRKLSSTNELAIVSTGGNSRIETYNAKTETTYKQGRRTYGFGGHYTLGLSDQAEDNQEDAELVENARNWDAALNYEQELTRKVGAYIGVQYEGDRFSGYKQRENYDIGGKYTFVDTDKETFYLEAGYRYTEELRTEEADNGQDVFYFNKVNLTTELLRKRKNYTYGVWLQYLPNFTDSEDYQINIEPSLTVIINDLFSLKVSYRGNYDNQPNVTGNERLDWKYTTALVAKY